MRSATTRAYGTGSSAPRTGSTPRRSKARSTRRCVAKKANRRSTRSCRRLHLAGPARLSAWDTLRRQRASDAGHAGAVRVKANLLAQAEAGRALARLADLAAALVPKLFEAERRR